MMVLLILLNVVCALMESNPLSLFNWFLAAALAGWKLSEMITERYEP